MWEADEAQYEKYIAHARCPFLVNNTCSIYEIRPLGCRLFPKPPLAWQTKDCQPLKRFKKQRTALRKGKTNKETYLFTHLPKNAESIKPAKFKEKQYSACIEKLRIACVTDNELTLFNYFNRKNKE